MSRDVYLARTCVNCGKSFGLHSFFDNKCPGTKPTFFKEEEPKAKKKKADK